MLHRLLVIERELLSEFLSDANVILRLVGKKNNLSRNFSNTDLFI